MMDLNQLQSFLALAETLSFTRAARQVGLSQPSVSRQIRALEDELGADLFQRDRHRVELTPLGRELNAGLRPLLNEARKVMENALTSTRRVEGPLRFGCLREIGQSFFVDTLLEFQARHPAVDLRMAFLDVGEIIDQVRAGELDFGVSTRLLLAENMRAYPLLDEESVLVTRSSNSAPLKDLSSACFVAYHEADTLLRDFLARNFSKSAPQRLGRLWTVNSHHSMIGILLHQDCYAVLPLMSVRAEIEAGRLRVASEKRLRGKLYLYHHETEHMTLKNAAFRDFLLQSCRSESQPP